MMGMKPGFSAFIRLWCWPKVWTWTKQHGLCAFCERRSACFLLFWKWQNGLPKHFGHRDNQFFWFTYPNYPTDAGREEYHAVSIPACRPRIKMMSPSMSMSPHRRLATSLWRSLASGMRWMISQFRSLLFYARQWNLECNIPVRFFSSTHAL